MSDLSFWKDVSDIAQASITVIAVLGGAFLYLKRRQRFPRAKITHQIADKLISDNNVLLRLVVTVVNQGEVLLSLESGFTGVQQVIPCPQTLLDSISSGNDILAENKTEAAWEALTHKDFVEARHVEPNEEEEFYFDFLLDAKVKTVIIYSYFKNKKFKSRDIGWNKTSIYDLSSNCQQNFSQPMLGDKKNG
ncbi:MAG TPA: hypothetical protein VEX60_03625 [Pyrinomonadaceae bacterium]|nr:hypothetical protein [Pyrinomonadaceae bacterium]